MVDRAQLLNGHSLGPFLVFIPDPESTLPAAKRPLWDFEDGRAELETEARQLLRRLEDDKVLQGEDYSLEGLGRLAALNQEAGPDLVVHPATANGRDAMLRRGVQAALEAAMAARDGAASLLVAGSVRTSAGLEVRRRLFVEAGADAGAGSGDTTHVLAELLGFDPELVVPQHPG
ncbi:hypothetical protein F751_0369 [Auxenochlorella protothecoides]|uniref:Uncharacterized protein n=1 Tax=Auxenochlorella protothecoides TaxID=3075 RepID=A0A087SBA7_AUXPR|nr:hypothetical protein F751_0369 [Auxenochlorella protothecoides]KFM23011.1 hypothetical protein F751_0369 [Auxenochlorella protothecoides]